MHVVSINIAAHIIEGDWTGREAKSGIDKRSVLGPRKFKNEQVENDHIVDRTPHGGYDNAALVGEQWKIGSTILEVSQPRIPCRVFAGFWNRPTLIKEFMAAGKPGTYLRIIKEGEISAGDSIEVIKTPSHAITIRDLYAAKNGDRSKALEIGLVEELSREYREWAKTLTT